MECMEWLSFGCDKFSDWISDSWIPKDLLFGPCISNWISGTGNFIGPIEAQDNYEIKLLASNSRILSNSPLTCWREEASSWLARPVIRPVLNVLPFNFEENLLKCLQSPRNYSFSWTPRTNQPSNQLPTPPRKIIMISGASNEDDVEVKSHSSQVDFQQDSWQNFL